MSEKEVKDFQNLSHLNSLRQGKDYALFFAVNDYQSDQLRDLENPIKNATDIANTLKEHYGYETEVVKNPTYDDMVNKLYEYRDKFAKNADDQYPSSGQLLIFFTGHGEANNRNGYFLPADADPERLFQTGFAYSIWRPFIDELPCKHIMVAIDACYSGLFDPAWYSKSISRMGKRPGELSESDKLIAEHEKYTTRWFLTSGTDVKTPDQSRFVSKFLEGLRSWGGDDAILTSSELWTYIERARPRPHQDEFGKNEGGSSFLFVLDKSASNNQGPSNTTDLKTKDLTTWKSAKAQHTLSAYQSYLQQFPKGEFQKEAERNLRSLKNEAAVEEEDLAWEIAQEKNTEAAYEAYLLAYPSGRYATQVREKLEKLPRDDRFASILALDRDDYFAFVQGGTFQMGCTKTQASDCDADEKPVHAVTLDDFYIGRREVTVGEYLAFVDKNPEHLPIWLQKWGEFNIETGKKTYYKEKGYSRTATQLPVIGISWENAVAYCRWKSKKTGETHRLPTEAEWEYAARGGQKSKDYLYAGSGHIEGVAWFEENANDQVHVGGQKRSNALGIYDMSGNVYEWCSDWYSADYYKISPEKSPTGPNSGEKKVIRGGDWKSRMAHQRVSHRNYLPPASLTYKVGFRLCKSKK